MNALLISGCDSAAVETAGRSVGLANVGPGGLSRRRAQARRRLGLVGLGIGLLLGTALVAAEAEAGFRSLFNGRDLSGWRGNKAFWSVQDGAITGRTTAERPTAANTFLVWEGGPVGDFELRLSYRVTPNNAKGFANSGVQYRSHYVDEANFGVGGYQADIEAGPNYTGILYEERGRGILAQRGQKVVVRADGQKEVVGTVGDPAAIQAAIKANDWNDYTIIAQGNRLQHFINGRQTIELTDEWPRAAKSGLLALQLHAGEPMTVQFRDIRLKTLSASAPVSDLQLLQGTWQAEAVTGDGEAVAKPDLAGLRVRIEGNRFFVEGKMDASEGTFELVAGTSPKAMDVTTSGGDVVRAIYEVSPDTLKVCYAADGGARPSEFKSEAYSGRVLAVYRKVKSTP